MNRKYLLAICFTVSIMFSGITALITGIAHAAPLFFTDESDFQTVISSSGIGLTVESFESVPNLTAVPFTVGNVTVSPVSSTLVTVFAPSDLATDGTHILGWNTVTSPAQIRFTFGTPINAFGIDVIDLGDSEPPDLENPPLPASLRLIMDTDLQLLYSDYTGVDGNVLFAGVIDAVNPFTTVLFEWTCPDDSTQYKTEFVGFDRLQTSTAAVPEPATMLLLGSGLVGLTGLRRKFRKR